MSSSSSARPAVKRQYGSRNKAAAASSSSRASVSSSNSSPPSLRRSAASSLAPSSDWSDVLSSDQTTALSSDAPLPPSDSPPTSPQSLDKGKQVMLDGFLPATPSKRERKPPLGGVKEKEAATKGDLRSFFARVSPRKRSRKPNEDEDGQLESRRPAPSLPGRRRTTSAMEGSSSSASASGTTWGKARSTTSTSSKPKVKLEQLFLDPFETAGHSTLSCPVCSLSYSRTPEDMNLHDRHHKKVVGGCDWVMNDTGVKGVTNLEEGVEWGGKEGGRIVMVDAGAEGAVGRRVKDVLSTIDTELSATELTADQLVDCKVFLFITSQRKVIAAAVVQRIKEAYEVVVSTPSPTSSSPIEASSSPSGAVKPDPSLLRFGEDSGAIFCSPHPVPTILGVHRIWSTTSHRRHGLASLLLDHMASCFIYGHPIKQERRSKDVAFSQPTGMGKLLARRWTGVEGFRVFVE